LLTGFARPEGDPSIHASIIADVTSVAQFKRIRGEAEIGGVVRLVTAIRSVARGNEISLRRLTADGAGGASQGDNGNARNASAMWSRVFPSAFARLPTSRSPTAARKARIAVIGRG